MRYLLTLLVTLCLLIPARAQVMSATQFGLAKVGSGLSIDGSGVLSASGGGSGGSASFSSIIPSATTGTATVACGANALCWSSFTTSGNVTINITGSGVQSIRLKLTLGGTHTVAMQYNSSGSNVKWPGGVAPSFGNTSGTVFMLEGIADGSVLEITNYYQR